MGIPTDLLLDGLVAVLLVATIFYCALLDRRLKALRSGQDGLRHTIDQLNTATSRAEVSITQLKQMSSEFDSELAKQVRDARTVTDELSVMIASGNSIASRIGGGRRSDPVGARQEPETRLREKFVPMPPVEPPLTPAAAGRLEDGLNKTLLDALKKAR